MYTIVQVYMIKHVEYITQSTLITSDVADRLNVSDVLIFMKL